MGDSISEGEVVESVVDNIASLPADTALSVVAETGDADTNGSSDDIGDAAAT